MDTGAHPLGTPARSFESGWSGGAPTWAQDAGRCDPAVRRAWGVHQHSRTSARSFELKHLELSRKENRKDSNTQSSHIFRFVIKRETKVDSLNCGRSFKSIVQMRKKRKGREPC